jgi:hypothetical protein
MNRSRLYARAIEAFLRSESDDPVTARLDEVADEMAAGTGVALGRRLIDSGDWEW